MYPRWQRWSPAQAHIHTFLEVILEVSGAACPPYKNSAIPQDKSLEELDVTTAPGQSLRYARVANEESKQVDQKTVC